MFLAFEPSASMRKKRNSWPPASALICRLAPAFVVSILFHEPSNKKAFDPMFAHAPALVGLSLIAVNFRNCKGDVGLTAPTPTLPVFAWITIRVTLLVRS